MRLEDLDISGEELDVLKVKGFRMGSSWLQVAHKDIGYRFPVNLILMAVQRVRCMSWSMGVWIEVAKGTAV